VRIVFDPTSTWSCIDMTVSKRVVAAKSQKYHENVHRRGAVPELSSRKEPRFAVGPVLLGFFLFVVVGSSVVQIIQSASARGLFSSKA